MKTTLSSDQQASELRGKTVAEVQEWLLTRLATELRTGREKIRVDQPLLSSGVDSVQVVSLMAELEDWGGFRFSENPLDEHPTILAISQFVAELTSRISKS